MFYLVNTSCGRNPLMGISGVIIGEGTLDEMRELKDKKHMIYPSDDYSVFEGGIEIRFLQSGKSIS